MEAYRDQYATIFNAGKDVVLLAISADPDTTLASWAHDAGFQWAFVSDTAGIAGRSYGAWLADRKLTDRSLYVIAPDGRIAYRVSPFRQMAADSYEELARVIDSLAPPPSEPGAHP